MAMASLYMTGEFWILLAVLTGVSLLCCAIGFKNFMWFMSIGYGVSVLGIGISILILGSVHAFSIDVISVPTMILSGILILYGLRLAGFLTYREIRSASYRSTLKTVSGGTQARMPGFVKVTIWLMVGILYVLQTSPVFFRLNTTTDMATGWILPSIGAVIALLGLGIETSADIQKSKAKKKDSHAFVSTGLFRLVRCPNYLGEILFWTGIFVSGCDIYSTSALAWCFAAFGYLMILYVMISGAKRLEARQNRNYGSDERYQAYVRKTPILMHLIPVKSLQSWHWVK